MFKRLFKRLKETVATPEPIPVAPIPVAPKHVEPKGNPLDDFRGRWEDKWEAPGPLATSEGIEGDASDTDWGTSTEAVEVEKNAFAETVPYEDSSSEPSASDLENAFAPTVPALLGPE